MVFGVFDRLHPGHRSFLRQARHHGDELIAVVARDSVVRRLKNRKPAQNEIVRLRNVRRVSDASRAVLGDCKEGEYLVIKKYQPEIICLGYDQKWLKNDLHLRMRQKKIPRIRLIRLHPFNPQKYHSSILFRLSLDGKKA